MTGASSGPRPAQVDGFPPVPSRRYALLRRLPFLVVAAVGLVLWRSPLFPQERELVWEVPPGLEAKSVEIQIWQGDVLLKREERVGQALSQGEWTQRLALRPGDYQAEVFVHPAPEGPLVHERQTLHLGAESGVRLRLRTR